MNNYVITEVSITRDTVVDQIYDGIMDLLYMAEEDGIDWLSTQEIIEYLGSSNGNHIHGILRVMVHCGTLMGAQAFCTRTRHYVHVWRMNSMPF